MKKLPEKTVLFALLGLGIYLVLFLFFDRTIDLWIHSTLANTWLLNFGKYLSYLATGSFVKLGIALCFILIIVCDSGLEKRWTRFLLYLCLCTTIAILIGDGLKYLLGRYRPIMLFEQHLYGLHFFSSEWTMNSTPSGHTIRAFALLTALSLLFRRFTVVFISVAVLIGVSRVIVTAHYPSDVVFGAFIGIFTALWTHKHFFDKYPEPRK